SLFIVSASSDLPRACGRAPERAAPAERRAPLADPAGADGERGALEKRTSMLKIYSVILSFVADVSELTPRLAHHDPYLAGQLRLERPGPSEGLRRLPAGKRLTR